jgi:hypothetical protein
MNQFRANPKLYGNKAPIRPEMLESLSVEDIPKVSIGKLKSYANELDGILQKSRGALAEANAIRQAERDISTIANDKFLSQAFSSTQGMQVPAGVSTTVKTTYPTPTKEEGRANLARLSYGKAVEEGGVVPGVKFNLPQSKAVPEGVKQFIIVNPVTGAAQLNNDIVNSFNKEYEQKASQVKNLETIVRNESIPTSNMTGTYGVRVGTRPLSSAEKVASNNLYTNAQSELSRFAETKKTIDEAQKFVAKDAQGATPAEIKTFVSKDPNLTPLQSASFELVTKPEFRNATAQEKTDKVLNEYLKQGGELSLEFLAKVKTAFKTDVEKIDLGGGLTAITFGNNFKIMDANESKPLSIGMTKKIEQDQFQMLLNQATRYGSWDRLPEAYKETLASLTAVYGGKDMVGMPISPVALFNNRLEALRGQQASQPQNPILSKVSAMPPGWSTR